MIPSWSIQVDSSWWFHSGPSWWIHPVGSTLVGPSWWFCRGGSIVVVLSWWVHPGGFSLVVPLWWVHLDGSILDLTGISLLDVEEAPRNHPHSPQYQTLPTQTQYNPPVSGLFHGAVWCLSEPCAASTGGPPSPLSLSWAFPLPLSQFANQTPIPGCAEGQSSCFWGVWGGFPSVPSSQVVMGAGH